jgi:hypothetical protein
MFKQSENKAPAYAAGKQRLGVYLENQILLCCAVTNRAVTERGARI